MRKAHINSRANQEIKYRDLVCTKSRDVACNVSANVKCLFLDAL